MYRKRNIKQDHGKGSYGWLDRVSGRWKEIMKRLCSKVALRFNKIDRVYQKVILVVFFLSGTTLCVFFAVGGGVRSTSFHKVTPITRPAHALPDYHPAESLPIKKKDGGFQNIQQYKIFLDSLSATVQGKQILDSLRFSRPGLLDSLALIDRIIGLH